jgi:hypothetical protein
MRRPARAGRWPAAWLALLLAGAPPATQAGVAYGDPGWDYLYEGDADAVGAGGLGALDGTWRHDQADQWDGSPPGAGAPGGIEAQSQGAVTYLRLQDAGNPTDWGYPDPSNRRIWFGHDIGAEHPGASFVLSNGLTITFRARLSASGTLDEVHPDLADLDPEYPPLTAVTAWPATGKGYNVSDDGQGMFTVQENGEYALGFALALDDDTFRGLEDAPNVPGGLVMNNVPTAPVPGSDRGLLTGISAANVLPLADAELLGWREFWITIEGVPLDFLPWKTYRVSVYRDGSLTPAVFWARSSVGAEFPGEHLGLGLSSETSFGAVDVDFFGYRLGVVEPVPEPAAGALAAWAALALARASRRWDRATRPVRAR